jgi:adenylosuccinate synthase
MYTNVFDVLQASAYLIVCIAMSVRGDRAMWKSSNVAPLFHSLEGWPEDSSLHERVEDMDKSAKEMYVKLERDRLGRLALLRT